MHFHLKFWFYLETQHKTAAKITKKFRNKTIKLKSHKDNNAFNLFKPSYIKKKACL